MPRPYTEKEKEKIKEDLMICVLKLIRKKGYIHTSVTNIAQAAGTSKAFFYTLFPSKEILITEALKRQEITAVKKVQEIAAMQGAMPIEKLNLFLEWLVSVINHTFFFLTPEDMGEVNKKLSTEEREQFFANLVKQQEKILESLKISTEGLDIRVFGNMIINLFVICANRDEAVYYHQDAFDGMVSELVQGIVNYVSK